MSRVVRIRGRRWFEDVGGQCQGRESFLVKAYRLCSVIKTEGPPLNRGRNSTRDLCTVFTRIQRGIKSVMFYQAFHKDLLSASEKS